MNDNPAAGLAAVVGVVVCVFFLALLGLHVFFLMSLCKALERCSRRNRTMQPGLVWLSMIPIFHWAWLIRTAVGVGDSLKNEFADRDEDHGGDYGKTLGILMMAVTVLGVMISWFFQAINAERAGLLISTPFSLASLVLWIVYWIKIAGYSRRLAEDRGGRDDRDSEDDDEDIPPRRPSRPEDRFRDRS